MQLELHSIEGHSACKVGEVSSNTTMAEKKQKQKIASLFLVKMKLAFATDLNDIN